MSILGEAIIQLLAAAHIFLTCGGSAFAEDIPLASQYTDHSRLLIYRDANGIEHPVKTPADWARRRQHILEGMEQAMGDSRTAEACCLSTLRLSNT